MTAIAGAFCLLYVFIVGGQAYPLDIFPGYVAHSGFMDGSVDTYAPSLPEWLLGLGGVGVAFVATAIGVRVLRFMPHDDAPIRHGTGRHDAAGSAR
jgi:Ni/Fe-hydrogenase subunit HybB-like protein